MATKSPLKNGNVANQTNDAIATSELDGETQALSWLLDAFPSMSLEEIASAYSRTNCDANKTAEVLMKLESSSTTASLCGTIVENENLVLRELPKKKDIYGQKGMNSGHTSKTSNGKKQKKISFATGTISSFLGSRNARVMPCQNKSEGAVNAWNDKGKNLKKIQVDGTATPRDLIDTIDIMQQRHIEEFLNSMMGDGLQLDMATVKDVLGECGYDVQKSLNILLDMAATTKIHHKDGSSGTSSGDYSSDKEGLIEISFRAMSESFPDRDQCELLRACQAAEGDIEQALSILIEKDNLNTFEKNGEEYVRQQPDIEKNSVKSTLEQLKRSFPDLSETTLNEILESVNFSYSEAINTLIESGVKSRHVETTDKSSLPRQVLESLFKITEISEEPPANTGFVTAMRLKRKSKKVPTQNPLANLSETTDALPKDGVQEEEDEYNHHRKIAGQHWGTMKSYYQEAAEAYSKGERSRAGYLSEEGNYYKQLAREADEKASQQIFDIKNRDFQNDVTIDLHSQHVKDAIRLLKLHLESLACISSIHCLKVITGNGRGRIKRAVTQFLEKEGINWTDENTGAIVINIADINPNDLSFVNTDNDG